MVSAHIHCAPTHSLGKFDSCRLYLAPLCTLFVFLERPLCGCHQVHCPQLPLDPTISMPHPFLEMLYYTSSAAVPACGLPPFPHTLVPVPSCIALTLRANFPQSYPTLHSVPYPISLPLQVLVLLFCPECITYVNHQHPMVCTHSVLRITGVPVGVATFFSEANLIST